MWGEINKAFLERLKKLNNEELLLKAQAFKVANKVYSDYSFQRNYNTLLGELDRRGLIKE